MDDLGKRRDHAAFICGIRIADCGMKTAADFGWYARNIPGQAPVQTMPQSQIRNPQSEICKRRHALLLTRISLGLTIASDLCQRVRGRRMASPSP